MKKSILAISAEPSAIPEKPNSAAIIDITKNMAAQRNMMSSYNGTTVHAISAADDRSSFEREASIAASLLIDTG
jgi:hypothetical protein